MTKSNSVVDPTARDKYLLEVTAGPSYNPSTHTQIPVNSPSATKIDSDLVTAWLRVRIKNYHGLPHNSPSSSPYFEHPLHTSDRYSIAFSFVPKQDIAGTDAVMGFDYDHSIKHQLPPGFRAAMRIVTSLLDPGLYSDPYSDEPYLYGPALSSFFALHIGETTDRVTADEQLATLDDSAASVILEGASGSGTQIRDSLHVPSGWKQRRKHFLSAAAIEAFTFEKGRMYHADFFNPHLDFADFALRLPGLKISVARYVDEKTHHLRFVLKHRGLEKPLFVVFFKLLFGRELEERLEDEREDGFGREGGGDACGERAGEGIEEEGYVGREGIEEAEAPIQHSQADLEATDENEGSGRISDTATATATNLANSIYAVYSALGFGGPSASESSSSSRSPSPQTSNRSLEAQIDDMDDGIVENYLQSRHGSAR